MSGTGIFSYLKLVAQTCGALPQLQYQLISVSIHPPFSFSHHSLFARVIQTRTTDLHALRAQRDRTAASKHRKTLHLQSFSHLFLNIAQARHDPRNYQQLENSTGQPTDHTLAISTARAPPPWPHSQKTLRSPSLMCRKTSVHRYDTRPLLHLSIS